MKKVINEAEIYSKIAIRQQAIAEREVKKVIEEAQRQRETARKALEEARKQKEIANKEANKVRKANEALRKKLEECQ